LGKRRRLMAGTASKGKRKVAKQLDGTRLMRKEFELSAQARDEISRRDKVERQARGATIRVK
jgi:hypothetical protein